MIIHAPHGEHISNCGVGCSDVNLGVLMEF
jgi:hypothetical protein